MRRISKDLAPPAYTHESVAFAEVRDEKAWDCGNVETGGENWRDKD